MGTYAEAQITFERSNLNEGRYQLYEKAGFIPEQLEGRASRILHTYMQADSRAQSQMRWLYLRTVGAKNAAEAEESAATARNAFERHELFLDYLTDPGDPAWLNAVAEWWREHATLEQLVDMASRTWIPLNVQRTITTLVSQSLTVRPLNEVEALNRARLLYVTAPSELNAIDYGDSASAARRWVDNLRRLDGLIRPDERLSSLDLMPTQTRTAFILGRIAIGTNLSDMLRDVRTFFHAYGRCILLGEDTYQDGPNPYRDTRGVHRITATQFTAADGTIMYGRYVNKLREALRKLYPEPMLWSNEPLNRAMYEIARMIATAGVDDAIAYLFP